MAVNYRIVTASDDEVDSGTAAAGAGYVQSWATAAGANLLQVGSTGIVTPRVTASAGPTATTIAVGAALGSGSPAATLGAGSNDARGLVSVTSATSPTATGIACTVTFGTAYAAAPGAVIITGATLTNGFPVATAPLFWVSSITTTTFVVNVGEAMATPVVYSFYYWVIG